LAVGRAADPGSQVEITTRSIIRVGEEPHPMSIFKVLYTDNYLDQNGGVGWMAGPWSGVSIGS
jgi:hypothetical protein